SVAAAPGRSVPIAGAVAENCVDEVQSTDGVTRQYASTSIPVMWASTDRASEGPAFDSTNWKTTVFRVGSETASSTIGDGATLVSESARTSAPGTQFTG